MSFTRTEAQHYQIQSAGSVYTISGTMRLQTPLAYTEPFSPIIGHITDKKETQIDIQTLLYLNSSGIAAIGKLILLAKEQETPLRIIFNSSIPWQDKSMSSLQKLYTELELVPTPST